MSEGLDYILHIHEQIRSGIRQLNIKREANQAKRLQEDAVKQKGKEKKTILERLARGVQEHFEPLQTYLQDGTSEEFVAAYIGLQMIVDGLPMHESTMGLVPEILAHNFSEYQHHLTNVDPEFLDGNNLLEEARRAGKTLDTIYIDEDTCLPKQRVYATLFREATTEELDKMLHNERAVLDAMEAMPKASAKKGEYDKSALSDRLEVLREGGYFSKDTHKISDNIRKEAGLDPRHSDDEPL